MKFAGHSAIVAAAVALAAAPVAAQAASIDRMAAPVSESTFSEMGDDSSARVVVLVGFAALILGLLTILDDDDDAISV